MTKNFSFMERFKLIRDKNDISIRDLSKYCTIFNRFSITKATFSLWESGKRTPTLDTITFVANIFSVSLDWLAGRSEEMYTESTSYFLEPKAFPLTVTVCDTTVELPIEIPEDYKNYELRKKTYSLETRARINFLLYVLSYEWERYVGDNISEFADKDAPAIKIHAYKLFHYFMINQSNKSKITGYQKSLEEIFRTKSL